MTWYDGTKYKGDFKDGMMSGNGIITYANGDRYAGQWAKDCRHGFGKFFDAKKKEERLGAWNDD